MVNDGWPDGASRARGVARVARTNRQRRTPIVGSLVALAMSAGALLASAAPASASCATGLTTIGSSGCYTVPAGMTEATVTATGAHGGFGGATNYNGGGYGYGGQATATLGVTPNEQLTITVGGNGGNGQDGSGDSDTSGGSGGSNWGGSGGSTSGFDNGDNPISFGAGGGGGGATTVDDSSNKLLLEGGGGGGGGGGGVGYAAGGGGGGCGSQTGDAGGNGKRGGLGSDVLPGQGPSGYSYANGGAGGGSANGASNVGADGDPAGGGGGGGYANGSGGGAGGLLMDTGDLERVFEYGGGGGGGGSSYGPSGTTFKSCSQTAAGVQITYLYGPPQVSSVTVSPVTSSSATLTASINPENSATTYQFFAYGLLADGTFGTVFAPASAAAVGSDNASHSESQTITGLVPDYSYQWGVSATNAASTTYGGPTTTVKTAAVDPTVSTQAPTSVTGSSATLNGKVTPEGSTTTYYFEYGTTTQYGTNVPASGANVDSDPTGFPSYWASHSESSTLSNLTPGQTYDYRIVATNATGTSYGSNQEFTTAAIPGAPGGVTATAGDGQATVSFTPPTTGGTPTSYIVTAKDLTTAGNGGQTATDSASPITVTGLTDGDSYTFTVVGKNTLGPGAAGGPSNAVTPMAPPETAQYLDAEAGPGEANVSFTLPTEPGSSPITGWTVTATDLTNAANGGQKATGTVNANDCYGKSPYESCSQHVTGLTDGDSYTLTVTLTNADEAGEATSASNAVSPATPIIRSVSFGGGSGYFVDLYNPAPQAIHLANGWTLNDAERNSASLANVTIPADGNYLVTGSDYSLDAAGDATESWSNYEGAGYGVNVTAPDGDYSDAVGYSDAPAINNLGESWYVSGTGLTAPTYPSGDASATAFVRRYANGQPVDTGDNAADFVFVASDGDTADYGIPAVFGAPAPFDQASPTNVNAGAQSTLLDGHVGEAAEPNMVYVPAVGTMSESNPGTLIVRRTIVNCYGEPTTGACLHAQPGTAAQTITRLEVLVTGVTTYGSAGSGQAVLRAVSSNAEPAPVVTSAGPVTVVASTVNAPSASNGGGLSSTLGVPLPSGGLTPGSSVSFDLTFRVDQAGKYMLAYNALDDLVPYTAPVTSAPTAASPPASSPTSVAGAVTATTVTTTVGSRPVTTTHRKTVKRAKRTHKRVKRTRKRVVVCSRRRVSHRLVVRCVTRTKTKVTRTKTKVTGKKPTKQTKPTKATKASASSSAASSSQKGRS